MYIQGKNAGLGEIDWNSIIKDAVGGYAAVKSVQTQADLVKQQQQLQTQQLQQAQAAQQAALAYQYNPSYSGTYGAPAQSSNLMPLLLLGGAAVLIFVMMK